MPDSARRRLPPDERRELILAAARRVLAREGTRGFGLASVAHEAGIAIGLIGHHFGGIDGLTRALLDSVVAGRADGPRESPRDLPTALDSLSRIVARHFEPGYYDRTNLSVWFPIYDLAMRDPRMSKAVTDSDAQDNQELERVLTLICAGRGIECDTPALADDFFAFLDGLWLRWCYGGQPDYPAEQARAIRFLTERIGPFPDPAQWADPATPPPALAPACAG